MSGILRHLTFKRSIFFMVIGLVALIVYLYFFIGIPQLETVFQNVNSAQYAFFYSLALVAVLGSVFFWSAAWNTILKRLDVNLPYRRTYLYYWVGYFSDLVIPCATVCGELTRMYLVGQETKKSYGHLAASAITNRIVAYTIVTIGLYAGAILIFLKPGLSPVITNVFVIFLVGVTVYTLALLYLAYVKSAARNITRIYERILKFVKGKKYKETQTAKTNASLASYYKGFKVFRENRRLLIKPFVLHLISYLLGLLVYVLIFLALGTPVPSPEFFFVIFFIATAVQDAAASLSVGSLDIILASIFILYGLNPGVSGITAVLLRSAGFWFPLFVGFACVQLLGATNLISQTPRFKGRRAKKKVQPENIHTQGTLTHPSPVEE